MVAPPFALRSPPRCIRRAPPRCIRRARRARRARHSAARYYALRPKRMPAHFVLEPLWPPIATTTHTILCVQRYSYTVSPASTLPLPPLPPHSLHIHTRLPASVAAQPARQVSVLAWTSLRPRARPRRRPGWCMGSSRSGTRTRGSAGGRRRGGWTPPRGGDASARWSRYLFYY